MAIVALSGMTGSVGSDCLGTRSLDEVEGGAVVGAATLAVGTAGWTGVGVGAGAAGLALAVGAGV